MDLFLKVEHLMSWSQKGDFAEFMTEYLIELSNLDLDDKEMEIVGKIVEVRSLIEVKISKNESIERGIRERIQS